MNGMSVMNWLKQPADTQICGYYSWDDARKYYYSALMALNDTTQDKNFAETFRAIGQLMHLIQDMSVPEHTRNDGHYFFYDYEEWLKGIMVSGYLTAAFIPNNDYPLNIDNLFDTNQYDGTNPGVTTAMSIGLAEYSNANFLSPDNIFEHYPYPSYADVTHHEKQDPGGVSKLYLRKTGNGEEVEFLARALKFYKYLPDSHKKLALTLNDPEVYSCYASKLLPRAIGYSAQVLNFFFRGALEISLPENEGAYALARTDDGFDQIVLAVKNTSAAAEEMPDGEIHLIVKYKLALEDPFQNQPVPASDNFFYKVVPEKNGIRSIPRAPVVLTFDLSAGKIPVWATDVYLQVVYKGRMGAETNAIAVGFKDISEPTPFDYINSPKTCCYGEWLVSGSPEAVAKADTNGDGVADYDVYPHLFRNVYVKISSVTTPEEKIVASESNHTYKIDALPSGQYNRVYILGDEEFNTHLRLTWTPVDPRDTFPEFEDIMDEYFIQNTVTHQNVREPMQKCCELWGTPSCGTSYSDPNCCERLYENGCTVRYYPQLKKFMDVYRWAVIRSWMRVGYTNCTLDTYETPAP